MSEWKEVKLGEFVKVQGGYAFKSKDFRSNGIPLVKIKNLINNKIDLTEADYVDEKFLEIASNYIINNGDVLISLTGSNVNQSNSMVGKVAYVTKNTPTCLLNQRVGRLILKKNNIDLKYIFYFLSQKEIQYYLASNASGSANQANINSSTIENLKIPYKDYMTTKKIADILSVIDEKIETLQNINKTLEETAKAIFKSWFVDFDIVKAKANGKSDSEIAKEFGISEEIIKLFPSEFETSEIGKIPKRWEVKKLGDFFPVKTGKKNANIANNNGIYPFFTCSQEVLKTNSYSFDDSAILLAGNGDFNIKWYRGKFEAYQRTYVLIPYDKNNLGYLFFAMKHFLDLITGASQGSVIKFITKGMIENFKIVYPNNIKFINFFNQILDNIENNINQIQTLQNLRDTLLPKLINGEIGVDKLDIKGIE